jgi:hypothetical protein
MKSIFVGSKSKPTFLVEILPKKKEISIYMPDTFSKNEEFYEKYALGRLVVKAKYSAISCSPVPYKGYLYAPELIVKIKNKEYMITNKIKEI